MGTQIDYAAGLAPETTYGTAVAPTRFFETPVKMKYTPVKVQGKGMQPTKRVNRLNRNTLSRVEVGGEFEVEIPTKGFGVLLEAVLGLATNTIVKLGAGNPYQQVHTPALTDPMKSFTIQGILPFLGGGASNAHTYSGCVAESLSIDAKEGEILTAKVEWIGKDMTTAEPPVSAVYPIADLFTFVHGSIKIGGAITPPTTVNLATSTGTTAINITEFSLSYKNNLDKGGYNLGGAGKRSRKNELGTASVTGKLKAEYTDNVLRDAFVNQTPVALLLQFSLPTSIGTDAASAPVYPTLQIALPAVLLKGDVPQSNGSAPIAIDIDFEAFDDSTANRPIYIVYRTTDTAP